MENFGLENFELVVETRSRDEVNQTVWGKSSLFDYPWRARALVPRAGKP
jgi:hypothetical protein